MIHPNPNKYSKKKTNNSVKILSNSTIGIEEKYNSLEILSNWRAAHSYPMLIFKNRLQNVALKLDGQSISSQRLKRVPSILKKLNRSYDGKKPTMKLTQMQDIAGCRVIMSNIDLVRKLHQQYYIKGDIKHEKINEKDYITYPKKDGYRSIHLVYKYFSDKGKTEYNGLLVEIQIRSKLQHIWATAVEAVDFFTKQALKVNEGDDKWREFFRLMSSAFALMENSPIVYVTPINKKDLYLKIKEIEIELDVINKMRQWTKSLRIFEDLHKKKNAYLFLLELDVNLDKLNITPYSKRQENKAINDYVIAEKKVYELPGYDVVLVGAENLQSLKKAYPNYFLDTKEFLRYLTKIIKISENLIK